MLKKIVLIALFISIMVTMARADGFNIENNPGNISGSFERGDRIIFFDVVRGELNPRYDPNAPIYTWAIRVMDKNMTPILMQGVGHQLAERWYKEMNDPTSTDSAQRQKDLLLLPGLVNELEQYRQSPHENEEGINLLIESLRSLPDSIKKDTLLLLEKGEQGDKKNGMKQ